MNGSIHKKVIREVLPFSFYNPHLTASLRDGFRVDLVGEGWKNSMPGKKTELVSHFRSGIGSASELNFSLGKIRPTLLSELHH